MKYLQNFIKNMNYKGEKKMKSYLGIFKMQFKSELQYRGKAISGVATQFFWGLLKIYLYLAFMSTATVTGFTISQMISYIWLGQAFFAVSYINLPKNSAKEIVQGDVCYKFVKPLNLYNQWYFEYFGEKLASTILRCFPLIIIATIMPASIALQAPAGTIYFLLFFVSLIISLFLNVAISMLAVYLTLKTLMPKGALGIVNVVTGLLGGSYIPLPFMPQSVQNVLNYLPFRYISDLPFRIYSGSLDIKTSLMQIGLSLAWLLFLVLIGKLVMHSALKKTIVQGG